MTGWAAGLDHLATAIIGASRFEQVVDNPAVAGVRLEPALLATIDDVLGDAVESDPARMSERLPKTREP